jgi:hypothetical protein
MSETFVIWWTVVWIGGMFAAFLMDLMFDLRLLRPFGSPERVFMFSLGYGLIAIGPLLWSAFNR